MSAEGTVYLIHFDKPYKHAQHYIGWTSDLEGRLKKHREGNGARLIQVITGKGISFTVVRTWIGERALERKLKNQKNARRLCPLCKEEV